MSNPLAQKAKPPAFLSEMPKKRVPFTPSFYKFKSENSDSQEVSNPQAEPLAEQPPEVALLSPAAAPPPPVEHPREVEPFSAAIQLLHSQAEQLAEQARSDALEIGFLVARRLLQLEVKANVEPLLALVRNAVQRLGESRQITLRMCASDIVRVNKVYHTEGSGLSLLQIEFLADDALKSGDCIVESERGSVDGRLKVRIDEARRTILAELETGGE